MNENTKKYYKNETTKCNKNAKLQCNNANSDFSLDKLAQSGTHRKNDDIIFNRATGNDDKERLWKRARANYFGNHIVIRQINNVKDSLLIKSYWNTYYCNSLLAENLNTGEIRANYCKNRWCPVCSRIKTAQSIHKYLDVVKEWKEPHFITLSRPNVTADNLDEEINSLLKMIQNIQRTIKKRRQRNKYDNLKGIRKIEVTYNYIENTYHPHFHILVASINDANDILEEWMYKNKDAKLKGQNISRADKDSLLEIFKYVTKMTGKNKDGKIQLYPPPVMDNIFMSLKGRRTYQSFGFKGKPEPQVSELTKEDYDNADVVLWEWNEVDWISKNTGECLTGYEPSESLTNIIDNSK